MNTNQVIVAKKNKDEPFVTSSSGLKIALHQQNIEGASAGELMALSLCACLSSTLNVILKAHMQHVHYHIEVHHQAHKENNRHDGYYFAYDIHYYFDQINETLAKKYVDLTKRLCPISKMIQKHPHVLSHIHIKGL